MKRKRKRDTKIAIEQDKKQRDAKIVREGDLRAAAREIEASVLDRDRAES